MEPIVEVSRKRRTVQADFGDFRVRLGEYGYIHQGDALLVIEPTDALELSDALIAWVGATPATPPAPKTDNAALVEALRSIEATSYTKPNAAYEMVKIARAALQATEPRP